jgi:hypothetical protein
VSDTDHHEVVIVGGGPAGCSAGIFTARYGLDTVVFDRGPGALPRCAYLENYPGFPAGIDVPTFRDLLHDQATEAGCQIVTETVEAVARADDGDGFAVTTDEERRVTADRVVAAAWYDGTYLRPLDGGEMFETEVHHGEEREQLRRDFADRDGRTPIDGLYVAAPTSKRNAQAVVSAGQGAHVARNLVEDVRLANDYPEGVAPYYDWQRQASEFTGEWGDRDRWREWFENEAGAHDLDEEAFVELRESYIDDAFATKRTPEEVERQTEEGYHRLLDHVDDEYIRSYLADGDD